MEFSDLSLSVSYISLTFSATYSYVYNSQLFYQMLGEDATTIGEYLSWIFLVGGFVGLVIGGYLTDRFSLDGGTSRRLLIVIVCQVRENNVKPLSSRDALLYHIHCLSLFRVMVRRRIGAKPLQQPMTMYCSLVHQKLCEIWTLNTKIFPKEMQSKCRL